MFRRARSFLSLSHRCLSLAALFGLCLLAPRAGVAQQVVRGATDGIVVRNDPDVIAAHQLRAHPELQTAFAVVDALHSNWLRPRRVDPPSGSDGRARPLAEGMRSPAGENAGVQVYLDDHRLGGVELLRNIPAAIVQSIRHVSAIDAQARYGIGHSHGVIVVSTRSDKP